MEMYMFRNKCTFLQRRVEYLGYIIEKGYIGPAEQKVEKLKRFPTPKTAKQLQRFYGLANYFRKFIPEFSKIMRPLSELLKKDREYRFDGRAEMAFETIKGLLTTGPVLLIFKPGRKTEVHTDASKEAIAGILFQYAEDGNTPHPCYYYSRLTNASERNYHSFELESLAVVESLKKFRCYLLGNSFKLVTDCIAFKQSLEKKEINARTGRWLVALSEFEFVVEHRTGDRMRHVDALSRPCVMHISSVVNTRMSRAQQDDKEICAIIEMIRREGQVKGFVIRNGLLYQGQRLYVPETMQEEIIRQAHDQGHFGIRKTKERLQDEYYIKSSWGYIAKFDDLSNCKRLYDTRGDSGNLLQVDGTPKR
uniref:RNA-directed DNA polymerase n=1 Tax=Anopheles atroparvus TaxID=41427 RepID=A0AAG5DRS4_ANOAO